MSEAKPLESGGAADAGSGDDDTICFAELSDGLAVVRVLGRGSFHNSVELKRLAESLSLRHGGSGYQFIVDLDACTTMDSTFMGVLASVGMRHKKETGRRMAVVNANEQTMRLMKTLGIDKLLDVRAHPDRGDAPTADDCFRPASQAEISKTERIIHMIEAHQTLCNADSQNAVRFESVLKFLRESLEREKES